MHDTLFGGKEGCLVKLGIMRWESLLVPRRRHGRWGWPPFGESRMYTYNRGCAGQVSFGLNKSGPNQVTNPLTKLDFHIDFDVHPHVGHHVHLVYLYVGHHNVVSVL